MDRYRRYSQLHVTLPVKTPAEASSVIVRSNCPASATTWCRVKPSAAAETAAAEPTSTSNCE
jgi:hypothetical protein